MTIDKFEDAPYRNHEPEFTDIEGSVKYIDALRGRSSSPAHRTP